MRAGRLVLPLLALACLVACSTQRTLTIDSRPSGAKVWVNGVERGTTPVRVPFVHYGYVSVRLEKPGYASIAQEVRIPDQADAYPVVDLPLELTVRAREFRWVAPLRPIPDDWSESRLREKLEEARAFRRRALRETSPPNVPPQVER